jgi:hypothetical protein
MATHAFLSPKWCSSNLEDAGAKVLLCLPDGSPDARTVAEARGVPVYSLETSDTENMAPTDPLQAKLFQAFAQAM